MDMDDASRVPQQNDGDEIAKANLRGRVLLAGAVLFAALLIAAFQFYAIPLLNAMASRASAQDAAATAKALFVGIDALGVLTAFAWIRYALRILRHRQDPPPGAWLWRDTKIARGKTAAVRAWLYIAAAVLTCAACTGITIYIAIMLDQSLVQSQLPSSGDTLPPRISPARPGTATPARIASGTSASPGSIPAASTRR
jgi:hypothetical protein